MRRDEEGAPRLDAPVTEAGSVFRVLLSKRGEPLAVWGWFGSVLGSGLFIHRASRSYYLFFNYLSLLFVYVSRLTVFGRDYVSCLTVENWHGSHWLVQNSPAWIGVGKPQEWLSVPQAPRTP